MPMLWDNSGDKVAAFQNVVKAGYSSIAMGFNELVILDLLQVIDVDRPLFIFKESNQAGQANMSPK